MSVINNVLKDLETRESSFAPIEIPALENRAARRIAWKPLLLILLVMVSIFAVAWYYRQSGLSFGSEQPAQDLAGPSPAIEAQPNEIEPVGNAGAGTSPPEPPMLASGEIETINPPSAAPLEAPPPNQIIGLQMREADTEMHLDFALRDKVVSYMTERSDNGFAYHLRDIESRIGAPVLRDNRWLKSLSIDSAGDGVDIRFVTVAGIQVETRQQQGQDERVWRISFKQPEPVVAVKPAVREIPAADTMSQPVAAAQLTRQAAVGETEAVSADAPEMENETSVAKQEPAVEAASGAANEIKVDIRATSLNATDINRLKYALELINSGRYADAERLLQSLLYSSEDHAARKHLLALYGHHERHDRLARLAQNSLARYPGDSVFLTEYARSRYQAKAYRVALELLSSIPRFNADQHALAAACHQRLENHERAVEHYHKALALDAGNAKNWVGLGISQEHTADLEKALQSYRNAMKLGTLNERLLGFVEKRSAILAQVLK
jgi:hypothetical protein